jgi:hypothetical protein
MTATRLTLELEHAGELPQGRIGEEGTDSREFVGWLGLASALGELLSAAQQSPADTEGSPERGPERSR